MSTSLPRNFSEQFKELAKPEPRTISEAEFVRKWLPMFIDRTEEVAVSLWLEVAGHPFNPVHVIKDGKILFTVPALCRQVTVKDTGAVTDSVYEVLVTADQKRALAPMLGENYLQNKISQLLVKDPANLETIKTWNTIFARYNAPLIDISDIDTPEQKSNPSVPPVASFEDF